MPVVPVLFIAVLSILLTTDAVAANRSEAAETWYQAGAAYVDQRQRQTRGKRRAKNVILFIGDGMSLTTVTAARILEGQMKGEPGEENLLSFETFPATAFSKTYAVDRQVTDSASTATAMVTGVKTRFRVISMDETAGTDDTCEAGKLTTILEEAEMRGLATGVVSTARLTHATPASLYAHVIERSMEREGKRGCADVASQLIDFPYGDGLEVALGGGYPMFAASMRPDGRDLVAEWAARDGAAVVRTADELASLAPETRQVLGLFGNSHMDYEIDRTSEQPSLTAITEAAIERVAGHRKGYFLMIESGRIDHGHHATNAKRALTETIEFSNAIRRASELVDDDTLIIVTADHGHTLAMAGYPGRGNPILGMAGDDEHDHPYTTLSYANGPGYRAPESLESPRPDLTDVDTAADDYLQEATVPLAMETHGGADVPVYATGPGSQWVSGVMEQNVIYHVMRRALFGR